MLYINRFGSIHWINWVSTYKCTYPATRLSHTEQTKTLSISRKGISYYEHYLYITTRRAQRLPGEPVDNDISNGRPVFTRACYHIKQLNGPSVSHRWWERDLGPVRTDWNMDITVFDWSTKAQDRYDNVASWTLVPRAGGCGVSRTHDVFSKVAST